MSLSSVAASAKRALATKARKGDVVAVRTMRSSTALPGSGVASTRREEWSLARAAVVGRDGIIRKIERAGGAIAIKHYDINATVFSIVEPTRQEQARKLFANWPALTYASQDELRRSIVAQPL